MNEMESKTKRRNRASPISKKFETRSTSSDVNNTQLDRSAPLALQLGAEPSYIRRREEADGHQGAGRAHLLWFGMPRHRHPQAGITLSEALGLSE